MFANDSSHCHPADSVLDTNIHLSHAVWGCPTRWLRVRTCERAQSRCARHMHTKLTSDLSNRLIPERRSNYADVHAVVISSVNRERSRDATGESSSRGVGSILNVGRLWVCQ